MLYCIGAISFSCLTNKFPMGNKVYVMLCYVMFVIESEELGQEQLMHHTAAIIIGK